jgi:hypothetical protein
MAAGMLRPPCGTVRVTDTREAVMSDDTLKIITNRVPREVIDAWQLSPAEREDFGYLPWDEIMAGEDSASFVRFRGELYDLGDFMTTSDFDASHDFRQYDGYVSDSFFSGVLVRYVHGNPDYEDYGYVVMATYYA